MEKPLFSIIIPIYKVEDYLDRCVQSAANQTYTDIEIILVDDGSPDRCPAMCDEYAKKDSRIKVVHKENGGLSDARNAGISAAEGEYIMLLDSDDYIDADACKRLLPYTEKGYDMIVGQAKTEGADFGLDNSFGFTDGTGYEYLKQAVFSDKAQMAACLYIFKRSFLISNSLTFKKGILHEDEQFTPRALLCAKSVAATDICFYHYIIRADSITTKKDKRKNVHDIYETGLELAQLFRKIKESKFRNYLYDRMVRAYLYKYTEGRSYEYGRGYTHKGFVLKYARRLKTRIHAMLFVFSSRLYCKIILKARGER